MFPPLATIPSERDFPQRKFCLVNKTKRDRAKYEDLGDAEGKELQSVLRTWLSMRQRCELHRKKMLPTEKRDQKQSVFEPEKQLRFENLLSQILDKNFIL